MDARDKKLDLWTANLDRELAGLDLWEQCRQLEARILRAGNWLARHPNADPVALARFEALADRHAEVMEKLNTLATNPVALIGVVLPANFGGAVPSRWERLSDGRILAWFTRAELEAATLVNSAMADLALESLASAA